jgi:hypothetical protein
VVDREILSHPSWFSPKFENVRLPTFSLYPNQKLRADVMQCDERPNPEFSVRFPSDRFEHFFESPIGAEPFVYSLKNETQTDSEKAIQHQST